MKRQDSLRSVDPRFTELRNLYVGHKALVSAADRLLRSLQGRRPAGSMRAVSGNIEYELMLSEVALREAILGLADNLTDGTVAEPPGPRRRLVLLFAQQLKFLDRVLRGAGRNRVTALPITPLMRGTDPSTIATPAAISPVRILQRLCDQFVDTVDGRCDPLLDRLADDGSADLGESNFIPRNHGGSGLWGSFWHDAAHALRRPGAG
jgi:hypothetical protein